MCQLCFWQRHLQNKSNNQPFRDNTHTHRRSTLSPSASAKKHRGRGVGGGVVVYANKSSGSYFAPKLKSGARGRQRWRYIYIYARHYIKYLPNNRSQRAPYIYKFSAESVLCVMQQEPSLIIKQVDRSCNPFFFVLLDALIQLKTKSSRAHTFHTALCVYIFRCRSPSQ